MEIENKTPINDKEEYIELKFQKKNYDFKTGCTKLYSSEDLKTAQEILKCDQELNLAF